MEETLKDTIENKTSNNVAYFLENERVKSFENVKHSCDPKKLAEAGFFYNGAKHDDDSATCFVCDKTLDGWETTDEPWNEHRKHAPQCAFVKLGRPESDLTLKEILDLYAKIETDRVTKVHTQKVKKFKSRYDQFRDQMQNIQM